MKLHRKKGFTLMELVVVLAIIAAMSAIILPSFVGIDDNKNRVTDGARDYYTAVQHLMSKFARELSATIRALMKRTPTRETRS